MPTSKNHRGQLGFGDTENRNKPTELKILLGPDDYLSQNGASIQVTANEIKLTSPSTI